MGNDILPGVEIAEHEVPGYKPLLESDGDWMAALMNGTKESWAIPDIIEQHSNTDELFVLVSGRAFMIVAGNGINPGEIGQIEIKQNVLYNVKAGTWHITPMTEEAKFVIIERKGTDINGSVLVKLTDEQRNTIKL